MKISGIICEYNPLHTGHIHHIEETRKNGATHIVGVMSGNFVQRGDVAIIDKFERAKLAVKSGIDLVIELPVAYCLTNAETYARGAVYLLKSLGIVDEISFGSECGSLAMLMSAADASEALSNTDELKALLETGMTYPSALRQLVDKNYGTAVAEILDGANNELGMEYIKAIKYFSSSIAPFTIPRSGAAHGETSPSGDTTNATAIRKLIFEGKDFTPFVSEECLKLIIECLKSGKISKVEILDRILLFRLRKSCPAEIAKVPDVGQGLENRIYDARDCVTMAEVFKKVKSKRYTMARIRRILFCLLLGITTDDLSYLPPYGRILATNERGFEILSEAKGKAQIPFGTSLSKLAALDDISGRFAALESLSTDIYALSCKKVQPAELDYRTKVSIID